MVLKETKRFLFFSDFDVNFNSQKTCINGLIVIVSISIETNCSTETKFKMKFVVFALIFVCVIVRVQSDNQYDRNKLEERLRKLAGGVAVVKVGGKSEVEIKEEAIQKGTAGLARTFAKVLTGTILKLVDDLIKILKKFGFNGLIKKLEDIEREIQKAVKSFQHIKNSNLSDFLLDFIFNDESLLLEQLKGVVKEVIAALDKLGPSGEPAKVIANALVRVINTVLSIIRPKKTI